MAPFDHLPDISLELRWRILTFDDFEDGGAEVINTIWRFGEVQEVGVADHPRHRLQALRQRAECVGIGGLLDDGDESRVRLLRVAGSSLPGTAFRPSANKWSASGSVVFSMTATRAAYAFCASGGSSLPGTAFRPSANKRSELGLVVFSMTATSAAYAFCALAGSSLPGTASRPSANAGVRRDRWFSR